MDKLLSTNSVATRLGLEGRAGQRQVVRLIEAGKLDAVNVSSGDQRPRWKVRESVLAAWIAAQEPVTPIENEEKRSTDNFLRQQRRDRLRSA